MRAAINALFVAGFGFLWCAGFLDAPVSPKLPALADLALRSSSGIVVVALGAYTWRIGCTRLAPTWIYGSTILFALMCAAFAADPGLSLAYALLERVVYGTVFFCWIILSFRRGSPVEDAAIPLGFLFGSFMNLLSLDGAPFAIFSTRLSCLALSLAALTGCAALARRSGHNLDYEAGHKDAPRAIPVFAMRYAPLVVGAAAFSFAFGTMTDLHGWMGTPDAFRSVQQANVFAAAGAAAAFMLYRKPFKPDAAIALVLPAFAAALLANPSEPSMLPFSKLAIMTGYLLYWSIAWVFVVREHARLRLGGPPVLALASGAMLVFAQTGRMAASIVLRGEEVDTTILSISSLMLFWLLVLLAIGTYWTSRNRAVERDLVELAAKSEEAEDSALSDNADELAACADPPEMESSRAPTPNVVLVDKISLQTRALGRRVGLSARETEVLEEFVRGRSAAVIADKLFVSRNTVKTHLRRIYEKAGVHSRQELLDIIENEAPPASIVRPNPQA